MAAEANNTGLIADTAAGDVVSIMVSSDPPYGVTFESDMEGNAAVIQSFEKLPNGKFGPLQKHGGLHIGDVLYAINDIHLDSVTHRDSLMMIQDRNILKKTFKFVNSREYYRKRRGVPGNLIVAADSSKSSFLSSIRRYRVSSDASNRKYVEYEIACQFRVPGARVQKDYVHKWSVYKRYSEFEKLNSALRTSLGWQLEGIEFPSAYTFSMNKLAPDFIEQRRDELNRYWQRVIVIDRVCDFTKHHCSDDIKAFLDVEGIMKGAKISAADPTIESIDDEKSTDEEKPAAAFTRKALSRTSSIRRRGSVNLNSNASGTVSPKAEDTKSNDKDSEPAIKSSPPPPPQPQPPAARPPPPMKPKENVTSESMKPASHSDPVRMNLFSQINAMKKD